MSMIGALSEGLSLIGRSRIASFSWSGSKWLGDNNRSGQCKVFFYYLKACINCKFSRQPFFLSIDGVVVCEEYEQVLLDAWHEEEEQAERKRAEVCLSTLPTSCHIFPFRLFVRIWCFIEINHDVVDKISNQLFAGHWIDCTRRRWLCVCSSYLDFRRSAKNVCWRTGSFWRGHC